MDVYGSSESSVSAPYQVRINGQAVPVICAPNISQADCQATFDAYRQLPKYCWIAQPRLMSICYVHVASVDAVDVAIDLPHAPQQVRVYPGRRKLAPKIQGNTVRFLADCPEPRYLLVDIDELPMLCVVIDPPESDTPDLTSSDVIDAGSYITDRTGNTDQTRELQRAIDTAIKNHQTLVISSGTYLTGALNIHHASNFSLYLAPGCILRTRISPAGENEHTHGIWINSSRNVRIYGRGVIDHQACENYSGGRNFYRHGLVSYFVTSELCPYTTQSPLYITHSANVEIEGITIRNGRNFNINARRSEYLTFRNCKVFTPPACVPEYGDGFHLNSCQHVRIENCLTVCNDDCFATGHYLHPDDRESSDCVIDGLVGWNCRSNAVRLGFYSHFDLGDFTFRNCDLSGMTVCGVMIHALRDAEEAIRFQRYGTIRLQDCGFEFSRPLSDGLVWVDKARLAKLELSDVTFESSGVSKIHGAEPGAVGEILLRNVTFAGIRCTDTASAKLELLNVKTVWVE